MVEAEGKAKCEVEWIRYSYCHGPDCRPTIEGRSMPAESKFLQKVCNRRFCVITADVAETCSYGNWTTKAIEMQFSGIKIVQIFNLKTQKVIEQIKLDNTTDWNVVELNVPVKDFYIKFDIRNIEQHDLSVNVSVCCGPEEGCPEGFEAVHGDKETYCFQALLKSGDWESAQSQCNAIRPGAHALVITDSDKYAAVLEHFKSLQDKDLKSCIVQSWGYPAFYTSGQRQDPNDCSTPFVWKPFSNQTFPLTFAPWKWGEPNCYESGSAKETCVQIVYSTVINMLGANDMFCDRNGCPFCETSTI